METEESSGGIVTNNGKVVVVFQEETQTWCLPKGHIDPGESLEETSRREVYEETGIKELVFVKELGSYSRGTKKDPNKRKNITFLHFTTTQDELKPVDPENPIAKWVDIEEVSQILSYEEDKEFFLKIKDML